jgi:RNA polymerase sigma factor (sigma-70 family)
MNQVSKPTLESLIQDKNFRTMVETLSYKALRSSYRFAQEHPIVSQQDLVSEGMTAACNAYKNFDPAKGAWTSYTYMYVLNAMQTFCKKNCHQLSISEKEARDHLADMTNIGVVRISRERRDGASGDAGFDIPIGSGVEIGENEFEEFYFRGFSPLEVSMFKEHVLEDKTLQEIARKYNVSKSSVYTTIDRLSKRMRERVEYYEQESRD